MSLTINKEYSVKDTEWHLNIEGEIDIETAKDLKSEIIKTFEEKQSNIVLNFENVEYIDSTGLGSIIGAYGRMKEKGKNIYIINPKEHIKKLLNITGLDKILIKE